MDLRETVDANLHRVIINSHVICFRKMKNYSYDKYPVANKRNTKHFNEV